MAGDTSRLAGDIQAEDNQAGDVSATRGQISRGTSSAKSEGHHPNEPHCRLFLTDIPLHVYVVLTLRRREEKV